MHLPPHPLRLVAIVVLSSVLPLTCAAQQAQTLSDIDAREQQLQQERERAQREKQEQTPDVRLQALAAQEQARLPENESPCFLINQITLIGEAADKFQWAMAAADVEGDPALGRCLGSQGINLVMTRIQNAIIKAGYVTTRVLAGDQDLQTGTLQLTLVPGRIHAIRFKEGTDLEWAHSFNAIPASEGDILNLRDIEQGLENFKRIPTVEADIQIVPTEGEGAVAGQSDLVISWKQARRYRLSLSMDDAGSRSSGKYQGTATLSLDNPLSLNDLFYFSYNHDLGIFNSSDRGTHGYSVSYSVPMGYWTASTNFGQSSYHQTVAGVNQHYVYSGESSNVEFKLARMLWRDATSKTSTSIKGWHRTSSNFIDDTEVLVQRRATTGWSADLTHRHFFGAKTLDVTLDFKKGTRAFDALPAPEEAFGEGTTQVSILTLNAQLDVPFEVDGNRLRYTASWRQQWNYTRLTSQDRFSIGNRYTVRGFDGELTLMGERGYVWRNDLSLALPPMGAELYLGLDYGHTSGPATEHQLGRSLAGGALGLRGSYLGVSYDVFVGQALYKPKGFKTASPVAGFSLNWSY